MPKSQCQQGSTCVFRAFAAMLSMLSDLKDPFCNLCVISVPTLQTPRVFTAPSWRETAVPCHDRLAGLIHLIPGVSGMWIHLAHSCNKVLCWTITFVSYCLLLQEQIYIYVYIYVYICVYIIYIYMYIRIYIYKSYIIIFFALEIAGRPWWLRRRKLLCTKVVECWDQPCTNHQWNEKEVSGSSAPAILYMEKLWNSDIFQGRFRPIWWSSASAFCSGLRAACAWIPGQDGREHYGFEPSMNSIIH